MNVDYQHQTTSNINESLTLYVMNTSIRKNDKNTVEPYITARRKRYPNGTGSLRPVSVVRQDSLTKSETYPGPEETVKSFRPVKSALSSSPPGLTVPLLIGDLTRPFPLSPFEIAWAIYTSTRRCTNLRYS